MEKIRIVADNLVDTAGLLPFDPRVVFDPFSERWYALSVDNVDDDNNFLFAVSDTSAPTQGWKGFAIDSDSTDQRWADFPMLGFDAEGVYLSANMFPQNDSNITSVLTTIVVLPKEDLLAPNPIVSGATLFKNNDPNTTGFTPRATIDLDNSQLPALASPTDPQKADAPSPQVGTPPLPMNNGSSSILEDTSLTIGLNFTGSTLFTDSSSIPPDTMGGVGPDHIVELINGRYSVYDIMDGDRIQTSTLDQFWIDAGVTPTTRAFDPRVVFDPFSERWYALSVDNPRDDNNFLFAVSDTSDPTQGWEGFAIDSDSTDQRWADFPMLGFDAEGVYLSANMFPQDDSNVTSILTTIAVLPKDDLLAPNPTVSGATLFENNDLNTTGFTPRATIDLDNSQLPALLFSDFNTPAGFFKRSTIEGTVDAPILNTDGGFISVNPFNPPQGAEQPGTKTNIDTGDNRFSSDLVLQDGSVWGLQTVDNGGRAALRWFEIDADTNDLLQDGLIADSELEFYYGSIAVNEFDDVVIGFSGSSENQFVSTYAVLGETNNEVTTFGEPLLLKQGVADYELLDGIGRNRWGDYSATVVDPEDPNTFWTFQEFVSSEDVWSTQITELKINEVDEEIDQIGIFADDVSDTVTVFNSETNATLGTVSVPPGATGDVLLLEKDDELLGFVTNFDSQVFVIDLENPTNPSIKETIDISNFGEDLTFAEVDDEEFLVVSDGSAEQPLSVIDLNTFTEVSTFAIPGSDFNSVEFVGDGTILTTSFNNGLARKLEIDDSGNITDTGLTLNVSDPNNVYGSPEEGEFGVVIQLFSGQLTSFKTSDLSQVNTASLGGESGIAGVFNPEEDDGLFYALSTESVQAFSFDSETGELGDTPIFRTPVNAGTAFLGMDQIAFNAEEDKLYVGDSDSESILILNANNGSIEDAINGSFGDPTGIAFEADGEINKVVFSGTGDITEIVETFRVVVGEGSENNGNEIGSQGDGFREINWDGGVVPFNMPSNFFNNQNPPVNGLPRGVEFSTASDLSLFGVSNPVLPSDSFFGDNEFDTFNSTYPEQFTTFSSPRLFSPLDLNFMDVDFFEPGVFDDNGDPVPALVTGFGAIFTDVDLPESTKLEFFDEDGDFLFSQFVEPDPQGLSFLGVVFDEPAVSKVRITSGNVPLSLGLDDDPFGTGVDVVAMDNFIYGEPVVA